MSDVSVGTNLGFCYQTANIWQVVGYGLLIFKILIPIVLIAWGMFDLGTAVISSKDDEIKKATKKLALRVVSAIAIFFLPTIVVASLRIVSNWRSSAEDDYIVCQECLMNPGSCSAAEDAWNGRD